MYNTWYEDGSYPLDINVFKHYMGMDIDVLGMIWAVGFTMINTWYGEGYRRPLLDGTKAVLLLGCPSSTETSGRDKTFNVSLPNVGRSDPSRYQAQSDQLVANLCWFPPSPEQIWSVSQLKKTKKRKRNPTSSIDFCSFSCPSCSFSSCSYVSFPSAPSPSPPAPSNPLSTSAALHPKVFEIQISCTLL